MRTRSRQHNAGLSIAEALIAIFVLVVGILGVLAAIPTGIKTGLHVIQQDCAIQLAHSKFAEFRRDRVDPLNDLVEGKQYMKDHQEAQKANGWRDFAHGAGEPYEFFDDIDRWEWRIDPDKLVAVGYDNTNHDPIHHPSSTDTTISVARVSIQVRSKTSTNSEFEFTQYLASYGKYTGNYSN